MTDNVRLDNTMIDRPIELLGQKFGERLRDRIDPIPFDGVSRNKSGSLGECALQCVADSEGCEIIDEQVCGI